MSFFQISYSGVSLQFRRKGKIRSLLLIADKALDLINNCLRPGVPIYHPAHSPPQTPALAGAQLINGCRGLGTAV